MLPLSSIHFFVEDNTSRDQLTKDALYLLHAQGKEKKTIFGMFKCAASVFVLHLKTSFILLPQA